MKHKTQTVHNVGHGGRYYAARCTCGWYGPFRAHSHRAVHDGVLHTTAKR